jgi:hypothetical protein
LRACRAYQHQDKALPRYVIHENNVQKTCKREVSCQLCVVRTHKMARQNPAHQAHSQCKRSMSAPMQL